MRSRDSLSRKNIKNIPKLGSEQAYKLQISRMKAVHYIRQQKPNILKITSSLSTIFL